MKNRHKAGILLPIFSLPSNEGIGTLGQYAYQWIDFLSESNMKVWQVLPIGITSYGDSPYQSFSSYAGNPYFIDLEEFVKYNWITQEEFDSLTKSEYIDYELLWKEKYNLLRIAFENSEFIKQDLKQYFVKYTWLEDYATFMALKNYFKEKNHQDWAEAKTKATVTQHLKNIVLPEIYFHVFVQDQFYKQWYELKKYANQKEIQIIGDIPIFVAEDSVDIWADPQYFQIDQRGIPTSVAGVPPDYFSDTGQLWGNPLYNWEEIAKEDFRWWINRIEGTLELFDIIRIDHFRAFDTYWSVPYGEKNALNGQWVKAPGEEFFKLLKDKYPNINIIAEDLGIITDDVKKLIIKTKFPGMAVLLFAFDGKLDNPYLPKNIKKNIVVYTGTHDNDTVRGWCLDLKNAKELECAIKYWSIQDRSLDNIVDTFIIEALKVKADLVVIPLQDILGLDNSARINTPSTIGNNWKWRLKNIPSNDIKDRIINMINQTNRI